MNFANLKARHRLERDNQDENLRLRIHRALSWLGRAELCEDIDGRFIFLWIAFNAAYAQEIDERLRLPEQETFARFLEKLCQLDHTQQLANLVWRVYPSSIRILLDNPFVFQSFWDYQRGKIDAATWQERFASGKRTAQFALASNDTAKVLAVVFSRLYILRNQLIHGGATWNGKTNREQLRDCVKLLAELVPVVISLMMDNPNTLWGEASFPVIRDLALA